MSQNLQNIAKFQKFQLDNLVDFEKCCKTHIWLQKSVSIQPKTSNILPKFCLLDSVRDLYEQLQNVRRGQLADRVPAGTAIWDWIPLGCENR